MMHGFGKFAAAAALALSAGGLGIGGSGLVASPAHAASGGDAGVSQFCQAYGDQALGEALFGVNVPVSQGACVSFVQTYFINTEGLGSSAIGASLCQTLAPQGQEGACVSYFNYFFKGA